MPPVAPLPPLPVVAGLIEYQSPGKVCSSQCTHLVIPRSWVRIRPSPRRTYRAFALPLPPPPLLSDSLSHSSTCHQDSRRRAAASSAASRPTSAAAAARGPARMRRHQLLGEILGWQAGIYARAARGQVQDAGQLARTAERASSSHVRTRLLKPRAIIDNIIHQESLTARQHAPPQPRCANAPLTSGAGPRARNAAVRGSGPGASRPR